MSKPTPRVIVVTGSSSGIGWAIARKLGRPGDAILLHARRNLVGLHENARSLTQAGCSVRCIVLDLEQEAELWKLPATAFAWKDRVDVWVNAAGADVLTGETRHAPFEVKLKKLWQTDVVATMLLSRMVEIRMRRQSAFGITTEKPTPLPSIINLGWDQAARGMEGDSGQFFAATKSAIMAFTQSHAQSVSGQIRVNCIAPGWIKTAWGESAPTAWDQRARQESCLGRWGTPEDVAEVASFLASDNAAFVNGQIIAVNGGWKSANV